MFWIAHRGNINGKLPDMENKPDYIECALSLGYDVEIDVWYVKEKWYLGHDEPQYPVSYPFLEKNGLWIHVKNILALESLTTSGIHYFWHQNDDVVLTSHKYIWTFPGKKLTKNSIMVMPELFQAHITHFQNCAGVCTDEILRYKKLYESVISA